MNHCLLEVEVIKAPTVRYTQDNQTPIAEMDVCFDGLRPDDAPGQLKVVGWGNLAQDLQNRVHVGQKVVIEGRLRMNTIPRQDGTKEKRAELTLSRVHPLAEKANQINNNLNSHSDSPPSSSSQSQSPEQVKHEKTLNAESDQANWNSSPLIPDTDDIPF